MQLRRIRIETDREKGYANFIASPYIKVYDADTGDELNNVTEISFNATVDNGGFGSVTLSVGIEGEFDAEVIEQERT